jgi:site-specific DNA recombinase
MSQAVVYARYSSDNQRAESAHAQLRLARAYCEKQGYTVVDEFVDEEKTGKNDKRSDFQRMIAFVKNGGCDVVVVHKVDRWARNRYDAAFYRNIVKRSGARLEYVDQRIDGSPESVILESVLDGMAEYYSLNLAAEVLKGQRENALKGWHNGGQPPLGYRVEDHRLVIVESEAAAVRLIFAMRADGKGYGDITAELDRLGYRTRKGGAFAKNSLHDLLRNKKYIGIYVFGRVATGAKKTRNSHADSENKIEIVGGVPAIIDMETWNEVQRRMSEDKRIPGRFLASVDYLLTGKVRCACGSTMHGSRCTNQKGYIFPYYRCRRSQQNIECTALRIGRDELENLVVSALEEQVFSDSAIDGIIAVYRQWQAQMASIHVDEIRALEAHRTDCNCRVQRLLDAIEDGIADRETIGARLDEYRSRVVIADLRLREIHRLDVRVFLTDDQIRDAFLTFREREKCPATRRAMVQTFIDSVQVSDSDVVIKYKLPEFRDPTAAIGDCVVETKRTGPHADKNLLRFFWVFRAPR